ncbi:MAG: MFS transporter [Pseudobacteriovorax sp.]|nr:MFS transporter [Pseudobacteriovorax sp.]
MSRGKELEGKHNKNVVNLGLVSLFTDMASAMVHPTLPLFLVIVLKEDVENIAALLAITSFVSYALRYWGGFLSDKHDKNKLFLLVGYGISALCKPLLFFSYHWQTVAIIRSGERFGKAIRAAPKDKLLSQSSVKKKKGKTFGLHKTLDLIGEFSGLVITALVLYIFSETESTFRNLFLFSLVPGLIAMVILAVKVEDVKSAGQKSSKRGFKFHIEPSIKGPVVIFCLLSIVMAQEAFYLLKANELGYSVSTILIFLIVMRASQVLITAKIGSFIDKFGSRIALLVACLSGVFGMSVLLGSQWYHLLFAFLLFGLFDSIAITSIRTIIGELAVDKGSSFGLFYFLYAICSAIGLFTAGLIWETFGSDMLILLSIAATGFVAISGFRVFLPCKTN